MGALISDEYRAAMREMHDTVKAFGTHDVHLAPMAREVTRWGEKSLLVYGAGKGALGRRLGPQYAAQSYDAAQLMVLLKMARAAQGTPVRDHFVDLAGYGAISGEIALSGDEYAWAKHELVEQAILAANAEQGDGKALREMESELRELRAFKEDAQRRLDLAAQMFDSYAQHHHAKTPPDGIKAQRNASLAMMCRGGPFPLHSGGPVQAPAQLPVVGEGVTLGWIG